MKSQKTSFPTLLIHCHNLFTQKLLVQSDKSLATKGSITSPRGRKHPKHLRPWTDFPQTQQRYFDQAYSILFPDASSNYLFFSPQIALEDLSGTLCQKPLASEKDLESYERFAVEEKVKVILRQLMTMEEARGLLNGCDGIEFENHLNTLSDNAEEVLDRQRTSRTDQACVFRNMAGENKMLFIREYKAAHKLSVEHLRAGLRPMEVKEEVVDCAQIPISAGDKLNYHADRLVASAVTQTFEYMIDNGLRYSSIATGPAEVFLQVLENDPTTVYYYLTEPVLDTTEDGIYGFRYPFTAIGRMVGFCLMALQSSIRNQAWRDAAANKLPIWNEDFEGILRQIPSTERRATPPASLYRPPQYPVSERSPYLTRQARRRLFVDGDRDDTPSTLPESSSSGESFDNSDKPNSVFQTPTKPSNKRKRSSTQAYSDRDTTRKYCTQKCLLGLMCQGALDASCPNHDRHRSSSLSSSHELSIVSLRKRVQDQLTADMDNHCIPLGIQGARGALFKITLVSHGYTFVGKGTVQAFVPDLCHEAEMYNRLKSLQGTKVPVCLGGMTLNRTYFLDFGVRIVHMLFLAWGGRSLDDYMPPVSSSALECAKQQALTAVRRLGVLHCDSSLANLLWNEEKKCVLVIDFERSKILPSGTSGGSKEHALGKRSWSHASRSITSRATQPENTSIATTPTQIP